MGLGTNFKPGVRSPVAVDAWVWGGRVVRDSPTDSGGRAGQAHHSVRERARACTLAMPHPFAAAQNSLCISGRGESAVRESVAAADA